MCDTLRIAFSPGRADPRLYFVHYIDDWRSREFWKGRLPRPPGVVREKSNEVPNRPCIRELFSLFGIETFGVSTRTRDEFLGQQLSAVPELFDARVR